MPNPPPTQAVSGPIHKVPCPHCGRHNDFRPLLEQQCLDTGHEVECDHCHMMMDVTAIQPVTLVGVRKSVRWGNRRPPPEQQVQGASTIGPAQTNRLLRRR